MCLDIILKTDIFFEIFTFELFRFVYLCNYSYHQGH